MRDAFVKTLITLAQHDKNIELLTGDLGFGVLKPYWTQLPNQFTNVGIAEQNMLSIAAGLAMEGKKVVVYSIGNFPTFRALEQIRNDCAYHNADVKIVSVGGGFVYGALGMSHHATEDIAIMRSLPNVCVVCPADKQEAIAAVQTMMQSKGVFYLRLGRGGEEVVHNDVPQLAPGKAIQISAQDITSCQVVILSTGAIMDEVNAAAELLAKAGIAVALYSAPFVKPLDIMLVEKCAQYCPNIVTVEEHNIIGGLGSAVAEVLAGVDGNSKLLRIGIEDHYCSAVGDQKYLRMLNGIDALHIADKVRRMVRKD